MIARDFIEESKLLLLQKGVNIDASDRELFIYLQSVYITLQKDAPQFSKKISFDIKPLVQEYNAGYEIIDGINLSIGGEKFVKTTQDMFYTLDDESMQYYTISHNDIIINTIPQKESIATFSFYYAKRLVDVESVLAIPIIFEESLRLLFLSRCCEKIPTRNDRNLSIHYLKRYNTEVESAKKVNKKRYKNITSTHQAY